jgi:NAD(P)-dependent dehydrogenase (short-subunit alcohol dehydrogenase family)
LSWKLTDVPDLSGRVAVVTGASSGLGFETAKTLAGAGAHVVLAARDQARTVRAQLRIRNEHPTASTEFVEADVASLESVGAAASRILDTHDRVDILVNNAGVMAMPHLRTADGFEMQFGVNHLGHWALTARLMPTIGDWSRVVSVTSFARLMARPIDPADPHLDHGYGPWKAYGQSKLSNLLFAAGLQWEFDRREILARSVLADPGLSHTNLQVRTVQEGGAGRMGRFWRWAARTAGSSPERGALMLIRAATDPRVKGGEMVGPRWFTRGHPVRKRIRRASPRAIETLWEVSERETGLSLFGLADRPAEA